jgi:hypothetical protein
MINSFASILEYRLANEAEGLRSAAKYLASVCDYIGEHYHRFDLTPESYGDLRARFAALRHTFSELASSK